MRPLLIAGLSALIFLTLVVVPTLNREVVLSPSVDGYVVLAPKVFHQGQMESVSFSIFSGQQSATDTVVLRLVDKTGKEVSRASGKIVGSGSIAIGVPEMAESEYTLVVKGSTFQDTAMVKVEDGSLVFAETDKPIYKPGQTVHIRVLSLDAELKPLVRSVVLEVQDAKGLKVFRKETDTDEYGMATLELPLSTEPNLGVWKVTARSGKSLVQIDVRVEEYVLPKYEVKVELPKEWFLVSEPVKGQVSAEYTFGKPVSGEVEVVASKYVGAWETFAIVTKELDGSATFEIPSVGYVAGVPGARGMGNVQLEVTVREHSTGYEEKTSRLLTISAARETLQLIPESSSFKPGLPLNLLLVAETPDNKPLDLMADVRVIYWNKQFKELRTDHQELKVEKGKTLFTVTPPGDAVSLRTDAFVLQASSQTPPAQTSLSLSAGHSPSGNFIHVEQAVPGPWKVGDQARFRVHSTSRAVNFYYEVVARGKVVFSGNSSSSEFSLTITPLMAPSARLLVYQVLPNSEVAADYIPFSAEGDYPHKLSAEFGAEQVAPGDNVMVNVQSEGQARVGLVAVDRSVFILAENRLNLQQVFDELERLYMSPQVELHEATWYEPVVTKGAAEVIGETGLLVITNKQVPQGEKLEQEQWRLFGALGAEGAIGLKGAAGAPSTVPDNGSDLAEVKRVRQLFPETWIWTDVATDANGKASLSFQVPDSITTWMLRAVGMSKTKGLGISEDQIRVFQPFFLSVDLPYSVVRSEEFPVKVSLYNYLEDAQEIRVDLEPAPWFDLLDTALKTVTVPGNDIGVVEFRIRPTGLGIRQLKVTARSREAADAVIKDIIVEPEGVQRELVENLVLSAGSSREVEIALPAGIVEGSGRVYVALTGSYLSQTIQGLEGLLRMPFGCGEQNMILFAPNTFILKYLSATGQVKPEIMAKAEKMMVTGYQRELTYRRSDGSFSAFGDQDKEGSLWLTAFVLKTFAQARGLIYVDDDVLREAAAWIATHQSNNGSFETVGFVHHQELLGGLQGRTALTAYVAVALKEAGETAAFQRAVQYLERTLNTTEDAYGLALTTYALELAKSPRRDDAYDRLMALAKEDEQGLHWGDEPRILESDASRKMAPPELGIYPPQNQSATIETTGYATLALLEHGDKFNASRAAKWLVSNRNALGGFGSTQDTVAALQALTQYASAAQADVDARVTLKAGDWQKEVTVSSENLDVVQVVEVPAGQMLAVSVEGRGEVVAQAVRRFNLPDVESTLKPAFDIAVDYDTTQVSVNDLVTLSVRVTFQTPEQVEAGMVVLDIAVPTGFVPEGDTLVAVASAQPKIKRYDVAGRKVIFYIEGMSSGESVSFQFKARALYPVKAQGVASQAYSYYKPELSGESLGPAVSVDERP
ncbi:MAG: alpha-2-macroglobulin [Chloroflexi bacterium]|nr:alpha-2-macroglobulin [Chloroflexota bacterium]